MSEARPRQHRVSPFVSGLIAIAVIALAVGLAFTKYNPFADPFELQAAFSNTKDIKRNSPVRIAGVTVGRVTGVEPHGDAAEGRGGIVRMEIDKEGLPIHSDARLKVRPRLFLEGNWFVDLQPGSPSAPVLEKGATIPVQQTSYPVQIFDALRVYDRNGRRSFRTIVEEYGRATRRGGARGINRAIGHSARAFKNAAIVNEATLGLLEHDLTRYIRGAGDFAAGLNRDPAALRGLVRDLGTTAAAFASEAEDLRAALDELPRTVAAAHAALGELNDGLPDLRRLVADMRPATRAARPALTAQLPLVRQLRRLVSEPELRGLARDLRALVPELTELNRGGTPLQRELRLLSSCNNEVIVPWREDKVGNPRFEASGKVYEEQVKWLPGIAAESRSHDANGQYVKSLANGANYAYPINDGRFFFTGAPLLGVNPPNYPGQGIPPLRPDVPCETQERPDLRSVPDAPPSGIRVDTGSAAARAAQGEGMRAAAKWLREHLHERGIDIPVVERFLGAAEVAELPRAEVKAP